MAYEQTEEKKVAMEKENENTDYSHLLKAYLPLSEKTYKELDDALRSDNIFWEDLSEDLKQAHNRFGLESKDYNWNHRTEQLRYGL